MSTRLLRACLALSVLAGSLAVFPSAALTQSPSCWFQYGGVCSVVTMPGGEKFPVYGCLVEEEDVEFCPPRDS